MSNGIFPTKIIKEIWLCGVDEHYFVDENRHAHLTEADALKCIQESQAISSEIQRRNNREARVLSLLAKGESAKRIAELENLSATSIAKIAVCAASKRWPELEWQFRVGRLNMVRKQLGVNKYLQSNYLRESLSRHSIQKNRYSRVARSLKSLDPGGVGSLSK